MATCILGLSGGTVLYVSTPDDDVEVRQYHVEYQGEEHGEDPYGVYEVIYPNRVSREKYKEALDTLRSEWDITAQDLPDGAADALEQELRVAQRVVAAYHAQEREGTL